MNYIATAFLASRAVSLSFDADETFTVSLAFEVEGELAVDACEEVYRRLNADDRPNRFMQRSMSVGDAVRLDSANGVEWFGVIGVGFERIACPTKFSDGVEPGLSEYMAKRGAIYAGYAR